MRATGRELTRRAVLAAAAMALGRAAEPASEAWDALTDMASALGRGSATEFLSACDPSLPGYDVLRANVNALIAAAQVESAIDPVRNEGDDVSRELDVDWTLHLVDRAALQRVTRRRQVVKCGFARRGRRWKLVSLAPVAFFAPPSA